MSKRVRNLLLAVLMLVLAGAAALVILGNPASDTPGGDDTTATTTTAPTQAPDIVIVDKTKNAQGGAVSAPILRAEIQNELDSFAVILREDTTVAVEAYQDLLPDTTALTALCDTLAYFTAVSTTTADEADSAYGLDKPKATLTVTYHDDTKVTLVIGNQSKGTEGYYCRREGDDTLYIIETATAEQFFKDGMQWIGKTLIAPPAKNKDDEEGQAQMLNMWLTGSCRDKAIEIATDVDAAYPGLTYVSPYVIKAPYLRAVDSDYFTTVTPSLTFLQASGVAAVHPTVSELEAFGLSDPYSVAAFTLAIVSTTAAENGGTKTSHYNDRDHMVLLGGKNENGDYYALIDQYDIVYTLSPASVPWAEMQFIDVTSKLLFMKAITAVESVTVTANGKAQTFSLAHHPDEKERDKQLTVTSNGKTYGTADFRVLYQLMIGIKRVASSDEQSQSGDAVLKLDMSFNDGTEPLAITLYPLSANRYLCVTADGERSAINIGTVDDFLKQYQNYLNGDPVTSTY